MHKIVFILLFLLLLAGCRYSGNNEMVVGKEIIPLQSPQLVTVEEFIADYDTIRLEATSHSLLSGIHQIHIMNGKFYITDSSMSIIFIYSMQGKYIAKICNQGEGPDEYIKIGSFETDEINNRLLLSDSFSKRVFEYDENGKLLKTIPLSFSPRLITSDKYGRYLHLNSTSKGAYPTTGMDENNIHIIDEKGKVINTFLKDDTPKRIDIASACALSYTSQGELLYMPVLSNTIFRISENEAVPEYTLDNQSGRKSLTEEEKQGITFQFGDETLNKLEEEGFLLSCGSFLHSDSLIFIDLGWDIPFYTYYSKVEQCSMTIAPQEMKGNKGLCEIFSAHPKAISGNKLYISVPIGQAQYVYPSLPDGKLKSFLGSLTDDDNPCILSYQINTIK